MCSSEDSSSINLMSGDINGIIIAKGFFHNSKCKSVFPFPNLNVAQQLE